MAMKMLKATTTDRKTIYNINKDSNGRPSNFNSVY